MSVEFTASPDFNSLFPACAGMKAAVVDLDAESAAWLKAHPEYDDRACGNPFLNPDICRMMISEAHHRLDADFSFGGYLENRRRLWKGSYLEASGNFIHLGIDFNLPKGTPVAAVRDATVVLVDDDQDRDGGWGPRIFLRPEAGDVMLLYAHLQAVAVKAGMKIPKGRILAEIGGPPENGNWHPHLHIQGIRTDLFQAILVDRFGELDGYGHPEDIESLRKDFPDPMALLGSGR